MGGDKNLVATLTFLLLAIQPDFVMSACPGCPRTTTTTSSTTTPSRTMPSYSPSTVPHTSTHSTTTKTTTTAPTTFTPDTHKYIARDGDVSCILMEAALTLSITYPLETGGHDTSHFRVPDTPPASVDGHCQDTELSQTLRISFLDDVISLSFTFTRDSNSNLLGLSLMGSPPHPSYKLSAIKTTFQAREDLFPGMAWHRDIFNETISGINSLQVRADLDYFRCDNTLTFNLDADSNVTLEVLHLKFKAFNEDGREDFRGDASVCPTDGRSTTFIIGSVVIVVVLIGVIGGVVAWLFCKRRRGNYTLIP